MALPTTITGISTAVACVGPFISSGGNVYFFGKDGTTATTLNCMKATDPTSSFSSIATKTGFSTAVQALAGYQVSDVIHLIVIDGATTSVNAKYQTFDMSSDTFVTAETIASAFNPRTDAGADVYGGSIVVRSGGEVVVFFNGARVASMGSSWSQTYYSRRTGVNTWSAATQVSAGGTANAVTPTSALGVSDRVHFSWRGASDWVHRSLSSANVLDTQGNIVVSSSAAENGISFVNGGNTEVVFYYAGNGPSWCNSGANPSFTAIGGVSGTSASIPGRVFNDGTDIWV